MSKKVKIELCMGSSCFARGNSIALKRIEDFIAENGLGDDVELAGHLCMGACNSGPHIEINGKTYSCLSEDRIVDLIRTELGK